jgi:hypothetical protein
MKGPQVVDFEEVSRREGRLLKLSDYKREREGEKTTKRRR